MFFSMKGIRQSSGRSRYRDPIRPSWHAPVIVFVLSLSILAAATIACGPYGKLDGDGAQYLGIGQSLALGNGYKNPVGPWPERAACDRMPGWPAIISLALWIVPYAPAEAVARFTNAFCLALVGTLFTALTQRLAVSPGLAALSGFAVSLSPSLVFLSVYALSEVSFVLFVVAGVVGILSGGYRLYIGALALGMAALIRTNFVLVPAAFFVMTLLSPSARRALSGRRFVFRWLGALLLAWAPSFLWITRNYAITGRFPLLSSIEGETLYGSNNDVVAGDLSQWGYWVMPDSIPGETRKLQLAAVLGSDLALNDYYHRKGMAWINGHVSSLPRLVLGKFVRAFVPVPWVSRLPSFVAFFHRFLLDMLYLALLPFWWRVVDRTYLLFCLAMLAVHLLSIVIYYGAFRFTHCFVEIFFVPCICLGVQEWLAHRTRPHGSLARL